MAKTRAASSFEMISTGFFTCSAKRSVVLVANWGSVLPCAADTSLGDPRSPGPTLAATAACPSVFASCFSSLTATDVALTLWIALNAAYAAGIMAHFQPAKYQTAAAAKRTYHVASACL